MGIFKIQNIISQTFFISDVLMWTPFKEEISLSNDHKDIL